MSDAQNRSVVYNHFSIRVDSCITYQTTFKFIILISFFISEFLSETYFYCIRVVLPFNYVYVLVYVYVYVSVYVFVYAHVYVCVVVYVFVCAHKYVYDCVFVYLYVHV